MLCLPTAAAHESTISADYADFIVPSRRTASTQIPIAPRPAWPSSARSRGFLPWGLSNACPHTAPGMASSAHTGRHRTTL